jgi:exosortase A-associated hydrolase 1
MRHLLTFPCASATLAASLDEAEGRTGILLVTGGSQTRIGSHRMYERLAHALASNGFPCFRYDRRGVGDSEGEDPGYRGSGPDIAAAAAAFRRHRPDLEWMIGFGLCDGATALALHGADAGLDGIILVNPWLVETDAGEMAPAAIRRHYRDRLLSKDGWQKIANGSVSYKKLIMGVKKILRPSPPADLASEVASALVENPLLLALILARGEATAIAAEHEWAGPAFLALRERSGAPIHIETDSHTFARPGDGDALLAACLDALTRLRTSPSSQSAGFDKLSLGGRGAGPVA